MSFSEPGHPKRQTRACVHPLLTGQWASTTPACLPPPGPVRKRQKGWGTPQYSELKIGGQNRPSLTSPSLSCPPSLAPTPTTSQTQARCFQVCSHFDLEARSATVSSPFPLSFPPPHPPPSRPVQLLLTWLRRASMRWQLTLLEEAPFYAHLADKSIFKSERI